MCGIAGFCNFPDDIELNIERMNQALVHRGPDESGTWMSPERDVVFTHRRLKVIDLTATGHQPMASPCGRYVIAYNGEIYNYKKIARQLLDDKKVTAFRGTSDTEVLLAGIEAYGLSQALGLCKGMFAAALYDQKDRVLSLFRDRIGEKPLYYGFVGKSFVFASELGAIAALENFHNPLNTEVLRLYFIHGYIPAPYTIYQGIMKLDAGQILTLKAPFDEPATAPYWSLKEVARYGQSHLFPGSRSEAADELERLLKSAISEQMAADVPVGAFLSAGIDSSTTVALMQSLLTGKVKTFTIGMPYNDEAIYAKDIARILGTDHTEVYISDDDAKGIIPRLGAMYGEPFADSSQIPTYLVSRIARKSVTVSLSGDAGDELFCGYNSYRSVERIYHKLHRIPAFARKLIGGLVLDGPIAFGHKTRIRANLLKMSTASEIYMGSLEYGEILRRISLTDTELPYKHNELPGDFFSEPNHQLMLMDMLMYLPDDILVKVDRAAMAVSLETRVPMLDKDVIEFAWSLPIELKREGTPGKDVTGKLVLRDLLYRYVPRELMERPKQGFGIPIAKWLKEPALRSWAESLIDPDAIARQGILSADTVSEIWRDYIDNDRFVEQIWYVLMFQEFMKSKETAVW